MTNDKKQAINSSMDERRRSAAASLSKDSVCLASEAMIKRANELLIMEPRLRRALSDGVGNQEELSRYVGAVILMVQGGLPVSPECCPFCREFADARCDECTYALTHGGTCRESSSAFHQFIEAYSDFGCAVRQELPHLSRRFKNCESKNDPQHCLTSQKAVLEGFIDRVGNASRQLMCELPLADAALLMNKKARYIQTIMKNMPIELLDSKSLRSKHSLVMQALERCW